jgi:hypothetical protein
MSNDEYLLNDIEKLGFINDGFIVLRNLIPKSLVNRALKTINVKLGNAASSCSSDLEDFRADTQCYHSDIVDLLYKSSIYDILNDLFGDGKVGKPSSAQVALRFPTFSTTCDSWHIDGTNELLPFNLLVGISLSDQKPGGGCLFGFRGSHFKVKKSFPNLKDLNLKNPFEIVLNSGDVVLMHQMTAHYAGCNLSNEIRYQVYFRIWHTDLQEHRKEGLKNIFKSFQGLMEINDINP